MLPLTTSSLLLAYKSALATALAVVVNLGRINLVENLLLSLFLPAGFAINDQVCRKVLGTIDAGTVTVFVFGPIAGLTFSILFRTRFTNSNWLEESPQGRLYMLLGVLLMWVYLPFFLSSTADHPVRKELAIENIHLALVGSTLAAFAFSGYDRDRVSLAEVAIGSLSGAATVASFADFNSQPALSFGLGVLGCLLALETRRRLQEGLDAMDPYHVSVSFLVPGVVGSVGSILAVVIFRSSSPNLEVFQELYANAKRQEALQLLGLLVSICIGACSGAFVGGIARKVFLNSFEEEISKGLDEDEPRMLFHDRAVWHIDHVH